MVHLFVVVSFQFAGIHFWPDAPENAESYLRHPHRHLFHVKAWKPVSHAEREVEIIALKKEMQAYVDQRWGDGTPRVDSCETIAMHLLRRFGLERCQVLEDGENGALVCMS